MVAAGLVLNSDAGRWLWSVLRTGGVIGSACDDTRTIGEVACTEPPIIHLLTLMLATAAAVVIVWSVFSLSRRWGNREAGAATGNSAGR